MVLKENFNDYTTVDNVPLFIRSDKIPPRQIPADIRKLGVSGMNGEN